MDSLVKFSAARTFPAAPIAFAWEGSERRRVMADASAAGSFEGTRKPVTPSFTASEFPRCSVATTEETQPWLQDGIGKTFAARGQDEDVRP